MFTPASTACQAAPFVLVVLAVLGALSLAQTHATLEVRVNGVEGDTGAVGIALWASEEGFPENIEHALRSTYVVVGAGPLLTVFDRLQPGTYAVTVFHDRNDNKRFDKNFLGIPREAWGVSNGARPRLRAPRFDEARFEIVVGANEVEIRVE